MNELLEYAKLLKEAYEAHITGLQEQISRQQERIEKLVQENCNLHNVIANYVKQEQTEQIGYYMQI